MKDAWASGKFSFAASVLAMLLDNRMSKTTRVESVGHEQVVTPDLIRDPDTRPLDNAGSVADMDAESSSA
jgi:hypothetical protein